MMNIKKICMVIACFATMGVTYGMASTLEDVKARGYLKCSANAGGVFGLSYTDDKGMWQGMDVEGCRAVATAVFGDKNKVKFFPLTNKTRFTALRSGQIDVLFRNATWTLSRDTKLGLDFVGINLYDGQGFIVHKKLGVKSARELDGATICIQPGSTTELNIAEYFKSNGISYEPVTVETVEAGSKALKASRCDVFTHDVTGLSGMRASMPNPQEWVILPEVISKEPLGPAVRHGDNQWADIVRWTLNTMIAAEEFGITSKNVDSKKTSKNQEVLRILGYKGTLGKFLGLPKNFGYAIIKQVGNYGEVYDRTMKLTGLPRGLNRLWTKGGLLYAPPFR